MAAQPNTVKVIDQIQVAPPQGCVSTTIVPLTFLDSIWFVCCPVQRIFFYDFPHPTLHFTQTLLPHLKETERALTEAELLRRRYELLYLSGKVEEMTKPPFDVLFRQEPFSFRFKTILKHTFPSLHALYRRQQGYKE